MLALVIILLASLGILTFRRIGTYHRRICISVYEDCGIFYQDPVSFYYVRNLYCQAGSKAFGVAFNQSEDPVTEEEIISIVDEAHEQGVIEENEAEMIQNIMEFTDTEAKDIMTHRKNVIAFDEEDNLQTIVDTMLEEGNSRYPVFRETIDNIVGIIHYKDALKFLTRNSWAKFKPLKDLPGLIREASFIPETRGISDLFKSMQMKKFIWQW